MKALVTTRCGPPEVLHEREIPIPVPGEGEVLIKLYASAVNPLDGFVIRGPFFSVPIIGERLKPKHPIAGADIAGRVESVGPGAKRFQPGDGVFGGSFGPHGLGGFAEYVCAAEESLARKPANITFDQAAAVPVAAITALQALRDYGHIQPGQRVLIDGASGGVGTFAVQIAKSYGAEVTAVCSAGKMDTARSIGADHVIDYGREDFTKSGQLYDLIVGANAHHSIFDYRRALTPDGIFVIAGGSIGRLLQAVCLNPFLSRIGSRKFRFFIAKIRASDLDVLRDLIEAGKIVPVIDRVYPLSETADALRYLEQKHAFGKVVIHIRDEDGMKRGAENQQQR